MAFSTKLALLNKSREVIFDNRGLIAGVMSRTDGKTKKYYTDDYKIFTVYSDAKRHQLKINSIKR